MAKYLVETYYTCTFKVNHYLDDINEAELKNLEKRDDGKFEVLDVKLDNRKTKSLDPKKVEYSITSFGLLFKPIMDTLFKWEEKNKTILLKNKKNKKSNSLFDYY